MDEEKQTIVYNNTKIAFDEICVPGELYKKNLRKILIGINDETLGESIWVFVPDDQIKNFDGDAEYVVVALVNSPVTLPSPISYGACVVAARVEDDTRRHFALSRVAQNQDIIKARFTDK